MALRKPTAVDAAKVRTTARPPAHEVSSFRAFGFGAAVMTLVAGMASGLAALSLAALFVLLTAGLTWTWNRYCLAGLTFDRQLSARTVLPRRPGRSDRYGRQPKGSAGRRFQRRR